MADSHVALTAAIVAAYIGNNRVAPSEIGELVARVHAMLEKLAEPVDEQPVIQAASAAQIRRSIRADSIVSFEDGRPYRLLTRHLSALGLKPEQYREKWGLPEDYPMTAPNYSKARSEFAKQSGLGSKGRVAKAKASRSTK